jgi:cytochrome P450
MNGVADKTNDDRQKMLDAAWTVPLNELDLSNWFLSEHDAIWPYFERLRKEDPVHHISDSRYGPFWSITKFDDIKTVDQDHQNFSSEPSIGIEDPLAEFNTPMFIAMDQPKHHIQRKAVTPVVAPSNLAELEPLIRSRVETILDALPVGETFNWVDRVSIELTTQMLATLFNFPLEDRHLLTRWSDIATGGKNSGYVNSREEWQQEMMNCLSYFTQLWHERADQKGGFDLISLMANSDDTKDIIERPQEFLGNLILLIVGGNDTTRNSISGGVLALNRFPDQYQKLREEPSLIPNMVAEIIRWQTPLAYMRRTALTDVEISGKSIKKGDKVVMWYASGNRDEDVFENADKLIIDRPNARQHVSFGFGIHRCMGNRLAEMQLRVLWEEIQKRFHKVEVVGEPVRNRAVLVRGYTELPVRLIPLK